MKFEKLINQFCLESAELINQEVDIKYYTVIDNITTKESSLGLYTSTVKFVTSTEGWLEKFSIIVFPGGINRLLVLVSPECPYVYIEEPSDILELIKVYADENDKQLLDSISNISKNNSILTYGGLLNNLQNINYEPGTILYDASTSKTYIKDYNGQLTSLNPENVDVTYNVSTSPYEPNNVSVNLNYKC